MLVFRVAKTKHIRDLSGIGARLHGGRWNHPGTPLVYASDSRSLATLEYLVHVDFAHLPARLSIATLEIPDDVTAEEIPRTALPRSWREFPPPPKLADLGTSWARGGRSLLLRVPSAIVEREQNILINPAHPEISRVVVVRVERHRIDARLVGK
jgi:RES domain-containing protein